jgi:hypothetical protein
VTRPSAPVLQRGDQVPHFEVTAVDGQPFKYSTIWQHQNLVLVIMPDTPAAAAYAAGLVAWSGAFRERSSVCVVTRDAVPGVASPGVVIADRWGEIVHAQGADDAADLPPAGELIDWVDYVRRRCSG